MFRCSYTIIRESIKEAEIRRGAFCIYAGEKKRMKGFGGNVLMIETI
jgi:hypothetical protein